MRAKLRRVWLNWRENRRQRAIDLALYRAAGGLRPPDDFSEIGALPRPQTDARENPAANRLLQDHPHARNDPGGPA